MSDARHKLLSARFHSDVDDAESPFGPLSADWAGSLIVSNDSFQWTFLKPPTASLDAGEQRYVLKATNSDPLGQAASFDWDSQPCIVSGQEFYNLASLVGGSLTVIDYGELAGFGEELGYKVIALVNDEISPPPFSVYGCGPNQEKGWHQLPHIDQTNPDLKHLIVSETHTDVSQDEMPLPCAALIRRNELWIPLNPDEGAELPQAILAEDGEIKYDIPIEDNDSYHVVWSERGYSLFNDRDIKGPYSYYGTLVGGDDGWQVNDFIGPHVPGGLRCRAVLWGGEGDDEGDQTTIADPCEPPPGLPKWNWCQEFGQSTAECNPLKPDDIIGGGIDQDQDCPGQCLWVADKKERKLQYLLGTCTSKRKDKACACPKVTACDWNKLEFRAAQNTPVKILKQIKDTIFLGTKCLPTECKKGDKHPFKPALPKIEPEECKPFWQSDKDIIIQVTNDGKGDFFEAVDVLMSNFDPGPCADNPAWLSGLFTKRVDVKGRASGFFLIAPM